MAGIVRYRIVGFIIPKNATELYLLTTLPARHLDVHNKIGNLDLVDEPLPRAADYPVRT